MFQYICAKARSFKCVNCLCLFVYKMPKRRGNNEIQIARGRLKGILQDLADLDDDYDESDKINLPLRGRPPKRPKQEKNDSLTSVHESFVMKLFDRSLDLAKFQENTPLYSICRSWNLNKPRANIPDNENEVRYDETHKREKMPELEEKILKNDIGLIFNMPAQKEFVEEVTKKEKKIINDFTINTSSLSKQDIMKNHKLHWKKVKEDWMEKVKKRHDRYDLSFKLLNAIKDI